jgi:hypothetical protein
VNNSVPSQFVGPDEWAKGVSPNHEARRAVALVQESRPEVWAEAFSQVLSSRTPWMDVVEAWKAVSSGQEIPETNSLLREPEGAAMRAIARREWC